MIVRSWHGKVTSAKAVAYHQYLLDTGLKDYSAIKGNGGGFLLKREEGNITHFQTLTFWDDYNAIKEFAGTEYEKARYYPQDKDYLLEFELLVTHAVVLEKW